MTGNQEAGVSEPDNATINHWPYLQEAHAGWLDYDRIREQGRFLLYRALNLQQIVAFLGAGLSMAYGRISWADLAYTHALHILRFKRGAAGNGTPRGRNLDSLLTMLRNQVDDYEKKRTIDQVFVLNLCEQFWCLLDFDQIRALAEQMGMREENGAKEKFATPEDYGRSCFQSVLKRETFDESRNIYSILNGYFLPLDEIPEGEEDLVFISPLTKSEPPEDLRTKWKDVINSLVEFVPHDRANLSSGRTSSYFFHKKVFTGACSELEKNKLYNAPIYSSAYHLFISMRDSIKGEYRDHTPIPPACYFMTGLALDIIRYEDSCRSAHARISDGSSGEEGLFRAWLRAVGTASPVPFRHRDEVVAKQHDPLHCLIQELNVNRLATINYDLEVERYLDDLGFGSHPSASASGYAGYERTGPLGGRSRDIALDGDRTADLIDFAVSEDEYAVQVVHLHGRSTSDSSLVVTDRDYRATYIDNGEVADTYRQGLSILFGGNPVLFVGVGLNEDDLLRPLREFLTLEPDVNRPVLALMPALDSPETCRATTIKHFSRYGIYVLYHGLAGTSEKPDAWLYKVLQLCKSIATSFSNLVEHLEAVHRAACTHADKPSEARNELPRAAVDAKGKLTEHLGTCQEILKRESFYAIEGTTHVRSKADIKQELIALEEIVKTALAVLSRMSPDELTDRERRLFRALRTWTASVESAVLTKSLCAALLGIKQSWHDWWKAWKIPPAPRGQHSSYIGLPPPWSLATSPPPSLVSQATSTRTNIVVRHYAIAGNVSSDAAQFIVEALNRRATARRIVAVSGPMGSGKGLLFMSLLRHLQGCDKNPYKSAFFAGFSFSCEVASVWDSLIQFIGDYGSHTGRTKMAPTSLRTERLREAIDRRRARGAASKGERQLIVLNSLDMLFHQNGEAKNTEINDIMRILFGPYMANTDIDIVVFVRSDRCPLFLAGAAPAGRKTPALPRYRNPPAPVTFRSGPNSVSSGQNILLDLTSRSRSFAGKIDETPYEGPDATVYGQYLLHHILKNEALNKNIPQEEMQECLSIGRIGQNNKLMNVLDEVTNYWYLNWISDHNPKILKDNDNKFIANIDKSSIMKDLIAFANPDRSTFNGISDPLDEKLSDDEIELIISAKFHETIIRHLAIISIPVAAAVLAYCPALVRIYDQIVPKTADNDRGKADRCLRLQFLTGLALQIIVDIKGLAFRIDHLGAKSGDSSETPMDIWPRRYQVHRGVQHFVYNKLGAQITEPVEGTLFIPSLSTSQASSLPQLNADAYIFLYDVVCALTDYPSATTGPAADNGKARPARLRAALGVVRTLLSFGMVCRFANLQSLPAPGLGGLGQLERHRLLLRWMLAEAVKCNPKEQDGKVEPVEPKDAPPFYQDETAWLMNEIGVLSLVQGRCREAETFVTRAIQASKEAEGGVGTMARRMMLNRGLCAIDLGQLSQAQRYFDEVRQCEDEELLLRTLADGYSALIKHLKGNYDLAEEEYRKSIDTLTRMNHRRPVSYLRRGLADLLRRRGLVGEARQELDHALRVAEAGGFADFYHFAQLSAVRLNLTTGVPLADMLRDVTQAEQYAERMDIPRLRIEALRTRAEIFLTQGETQLAGDMAAKAMRVAKLNDLVLRRISLTELLSRILRQRGNLAAADRMQSMAERSARRVGYHMTSSKPWGIPGPVSARLPPPQL